jgi:hypothetical protein
MKAIYLIAALLLVSQFVSGQTVVPQDSTKVAPTDTINRSKGNDDQQLKEIKEVKVEKLSDSTGNEPAKSSLVDTTKQSKYGNLLIDDPEYNKRYSIWIPPVEIIGLNVLLNVADRYVLKLPFANVDLTTWKRTLSSGFPWGPGWEWDFDRFGNNFISHPYFGGMYYNAARSNGYNFYVSTAFSLGGAYMWKMFGENGTPEREDLINTSVTGAFLGEILYRLSSNVLDDRTRGGERVLREVAAAIIDPVRGFNRLVQGKMFRKTNKEVYQKEPINISVYGGIRETNDKTYGVFGKGTINPMINLQLDYGNPFEIRSRKAFDFFKLRADFNFDVGRKILDNVTGYGILGGKNYQVGKLVVLLGGYQYYDYWDSKEFELGTIALGGGLITKYPLSKTSNIYTALHFAIVPFAGLSKLSGPDTSQIRDYNFGYGYEAKFETTVNLNKYATASLLYYFYMIRTFNHVVGDHYLNIFKPRITVRVYKNLSLGVENYIYFDDRWEHGAPPSHEVKTEQKFFILFYLQDKQRRGDYN